MNKEPSQSETRRVIAACRSCRHSKLKCSGTQPCNRCQKRSRECIYDSREELDAHDDRVAPSRKRLRLDEEHVPRPSPSQVRNPPTPPQLTALQSIPNTQTTSQETGDASPHFLRNRLDKRKRWLYLGASSTWSFNIRVATLIRSHLKDNTGDKYEGFALDGDAYNVSLRKVGSDTRLDLSRLPSLDYAIYIINTVKFHLGGILRLFEEEEFLQNLHEFYSEGPNKAGAHRLWYTQCLLLLALGKGFLNVRHSPDNTSSADFFLRAMSILPDTMVLHDEPVLAAEVLATIALYFYCLDMKHCAYSYIGQALRLALVEGLHADLPVAQIGTKFSERCRNVWWTVYILDRTLSSAVGAPVSVQDDHIRQPLGSARQSSQREATLIMHVKLCRVVSYILTELYTADGNLEHSYLSKTRSVLRHIAEIAKELEEIIDFKFKSSLETLSKGALYLRMLYNQCIILATKPLLICLLQDILSSLSSGTRRKMDIPSSIRDLLQMCAAAATKTLKMLVVLADYSLLDAFLPFDLEFACSASSVLVTLDEVLRGQNISPTTKALISKVLDEITAGGNKVAPLRQRELQQVSHLAHRLWEAIEAREQTNATQEQDTNQTIEIQPSDETQVIIDGSDYQQQQHQGAGVIPGVQSSQPTNGYPNDIFPVNDAASVMSPLSTASADFAETFDFSQEQMLFLADHLDDEALPPMLDFGSHGLDEWL